MRQTKINIMALHSGNDKIYWARSELTQDRSRPAHELNSKYMDGASHINDSNTGQC